MYKRPKQKKCIYAIASDSHILVLPSIHHSTVAPNIHRTLANLKTKPKNPNKLIPIPNLYKVSIESKYQHCYQSFNIISILIKVINISWAIKKPIKWITCPTFLGNFYEVIKVDTKFENTLQFNIFQYKYKTNLIHKIKLYS